MDGQTDRQMDKQTDRQADQQTDRQIDRQKGLTGLLYQNDGIATERTVNTTFQPKPSSGVW